MLVVLIQSVALSAEFDKEKKVRKERQVFKGDRKKFQEVPDSFFKMTYKDKKGVEHLVMREGHDYMTKEMVVSDKSISSGVKEMLLKSYNELKNKNESLKTEGAKK